MKVNKQSVYKEGGRCVWGMDGGVRRIDYKNGVDGRVIAIVQEYGGVSRR